MACTRRLYQDAGVEVEIIVRGLRAVAIADQLTEPCAGLVERLLTWPPAAPSALEPELQPTAEEQPTAARADSLAESAQASLPGRADTSTQAAALARASQAGADARRKIDGLVQTVPPTGPHPSGARNRYYVVLEPSLVATQQPGVYVRWNPGARGEEGARNAVCVPGRSEPSEETVFHGFATMGEVDAYCAGAGMPRPPTRG